MPRITLFSAAGGKSHIVPPSSSSASVSASVAVPSSSVVDHESSDESSDATEEVDELDSASNDEDEPPQAQVQWGPTPSSASANTAAGGTAPPSERPRAKKRPKPATTRMPGQALVPVSRVESILQQDPQNASVSKEAIYIIALAAEEFIRHITRVSQARAMYDKRSLTTLNDFADTAEYFNEYKFLKDMIPKPMPLAQAIEKRKEIIAKREALLSGADAVPLPPSMPSSRRVAPSAGASASARRKRGSKVAGGASGKSRTVSTGSDVSGIRSERVRRRSRLVPDQKEEIEQNETKLEELANVGEPVDIPMEHDPASSPPPAPMKIKIKARSSATPASAGTSTPTDQVLELDTPARTAKPPAPVLELGPRVEQEVFVLECGAPGAKKKAPSVAGPTSKEGSLERKLEDTKLDVERSGSESLESQSQMNVDPEARNSKKRPPSTSFSGPSSAAIAHALANGSAGLPPLSSGASDEHHSKKRKKAEEVVPDVIQQPNWVSEKTFIPAANANGHAKGSENSKSNSTLRLMPKSRTEPHEDFREAMRGSGRTIYSARKPV